MKVTERFEYEEIKGFRFGKSVIGKPGMVSHVYYVDGLLIDTGHPRVRKQVFAEVGGLPVHQQFITHFHEDHTGNLHLLNEHFDCPAYASPLTCDIMKSPPPLSLAQKVTWGSRPAFGSLLPVEGSLETANHTFDLIPIPGHAPDMVALHEPNRGWLFSADLYIHHYISFFIYTESMLDQINSMKRVLALDFDVMLCGHSPQLHNPKEKLTKKLDFFQEFYGHVERLLAQGMTDREIFRRMRLRENWPVKMGSLGELSKLNMVRAVLKDLERERVGVS